MLKKWLKIADGLFAQGPSGKKRHLIRLIPLERHDIHQIQRHHHLEEDGVYSQSSRVLPHIDSVLTPTYDLLLKN